MNCGEVCHSYSSAKRAGNTLRSPAPLATTTFISSLLLLLASLSGAFRTVRQARNDRKRTESHQSAERPRDRRDTKYYSEDPVPAFLAAVRDSRWLARQSVPLRRRI